MAEQRCTLNVGKLSVYDEVAKTSSYAGRKSEKEADYERFFTTDADRLMLERFWRESATAMTSLFRPFLISVSGEEERQGVDLSQDYEVVLSLPTTFDATLRESMEEAVKSYFVCRILSSWLRFSSSDDAAKYALDATAYMEEVSRLLYHRRRPQRVIPNL